MYKGKLPDGSLVVVKILSESKGNGEQFLTEVASISRTSHVNIVTLLGFCSEGSKRVLFYQFMPNRSLEKYIFTEDQAMDVDQLAWEKIYQIAIGVAHGLEYSILTSSRKTSFLTKITAPRSPILVFQS